MKLRKIISGILATTATLGCAGMMAGCETARPEVEMQLSFQGETYTLNYTLYRKVAPATVKHFLKLAEEGYYDGLCVHDYHSDEKMFTGGYSFNGEEENGGLTYKQYYDIVAQYENFPHSVYTLDNQPTYTLFSWENGGAKNESYGALTMYYTNKESDGQKIIGKHPELPDKELRREYEQNSATSQFYISLKEEGQVNADYCTFATLDEDCIDVLQALQAEVEEYVEGNEDALKDRYVTIDQDDRYVGEYSTSKSFLILSSPVVIESVTVIKT